MEKVIVYSLYDNDEVGRKKLKNWKQKTMEEKEMIKYCKEQNYKIEKAIRCFRYDFNRYEPNIVIEDLKRIYNSYGCIKIIVFDIRDFFYDNKHLQFLLKFHNVKIESVKQGCFDKNYFIRGGIENEK